MLKDDQEWTALSLRFHGDALEPEAVSRALELEPGYTGRKGEHIRGNPRYAVHESNIWTKTYEDSDCLRFAEQIAKLVSQLERKETEMREILSQPGVRAELFLGYSSGNRQGGFDLPADLLRRLGRLGLDLCLDLYPPEVGEKKEKTW